MLKIRHHSLMLPILITVVLSSSIFIASLPARADSQTVACQPVLIANPQAIFTNAKPNESSEQTIEADELIQPSTTQYLLSGNVKLKQSGLVVLSNRMTLDKSARTISLEGSVELHQKTLVVKAENVHVNQNTGVSQLENAQYQILPSRLHGKSKRITLYRANSNVKLQQASLTACKIQSDKTPDWVLNFSQLEINDYTRRAIGKNTTLVIKDIPILYTPYFDYPLDNRATGLLFPELGSYKSLTQNSAMLFAKIPYFFNIANNIDDTLTIISMSQRGLVLDNEFRYLAQHSQVRHGAEFKVSLLQDQLTARKGLVSADTLGNLTYGDAIETRWRASLNAKQDWGSGFSSDITWHESSDKSFFTDIPVDSNFKTATQIPRHLNLNYRQDNLHVYAQVLNYLQLRNTTENYEKRPEIGLTYFKNNKQLRFNLYATATEFAKKSVALNSPATLRVHLKPTLSYQVRRPYGHIKGTFVANQIQYNLHRDALNFNNTTYNHFIPQLALQTGLVFERPFRFSGGLYSQTFEPTVQYLYVPYKDQSQLPLFDSGTRSLAFNNLLTLNRFTGSDRIGDANQIAFVLSSKLFNEDGHKLIDIGIGQIRYFEDRQVNLHSTDIQTESTSDLSVKLGLTIGSIYLSSTAQLDQNTYELTNANSHFKYQKAKHNAVLLNHTLQNANTTTKKEVFSLGAYTQVMPKWQLGTYISYDLSNQYLSESNLGLRYESCCWSTEIIVEHTQLVNGLYNNSIQFQFELKGISSSANNFKQDLSQKLNF